MTNTNESLDVCKIGDYVKKIKGLASNSASPTDTWIITFKDGITYNHKNIKRGFLKIFVDSDKIFKGFGNEIQLKSLEYEIEVYKSIVRPLIDYKVCPNFVKYLASGIKCSFQDLLDILHGNLYEDGSGPLLDDNATTYLLKRNIFYTLKRIKQRPSIDKLTNFMIIPGFTEKYMESLYKSKIFTEIKYDMMLNEDSGDSRTLKEWMENTFSPSLEWYEDLWGILFQICVGCYAMSLSKMVHNDLHYSNIFIKDLHREEYLVYYINTVPYIIKTRFIAQLYDFDRAYVERLGPNLLLDSDLCSRSSQCNIFVENKDIVKIFCYVHKLFSVTDISGIEMRQKIIELVGGKSSLNLDDTYEKETCFLQRETADDKEAIPVDWYADFNSSTEVIYNIYTDSSIIPINLDEIPEGELYKDNIFCCNKDNFDSNGEINTANLNREFEEIYNTLNLTGYTGTLGFLASE